MWKNKEEIWSRRWNQRDIERKWRGKGRKGGKRGKEREERGAERGGGSEGQEKEVGIKVGG